MTLMICSVLDSNLCFPEAGKEQPTVLLCEMLAECALQDLVSLENLKHCVEAWKINQTSARSPGYQYDLCGRGSGQLCSGKQKDGLTI